MKDCGDVTQKNQAPAVSSLLSLVPFACNFLFTSAMAPKEMLEVPDPPLATPALENLDLCYSYAIARGEMGVLTFEPYKSLILPFWAFRTVPIAKNSAEVLWAIFISYCERGDFVGADMSRKFIQMGLTRSKRYVNHKGLFCPRELFSLSGRWLTLSSKEVESMAPRAKSSRSGLATTLTGRGERRRKLARYSKGTGGDARAINNM